MLGQPKGRGSEGIDGPSRVRRGQRRHGILLGVGPAQRSEFQGVAHPGGLAPRDHPLDRAHLQPPPTPAQTRPTDPHRVRTSLHRQRRSGSRLNDTTSVNQTDSNPVKGVIT